MSGYLSVTFLVPVVFSLMGMILYLLNIDQGLKLTILAISSAVVAISLTSIGINLYNKCEDKFKKDETAKNDKGFLIGILIMSLISFLVSLFFGHKQAKNLKMI